jgi:hypothetical protein
MNNKAPKPLDDAQPSLLDRYVTTFEPENAASAARVLGYKLTGWTTEGYPMFVRAQGPAGQAQLVYETPLFEEFIPETFH